MALTRETVMEILSGLADPAGGGSIVAADRVRALGIHHGQVRFVIEAPEALAGPMEEVRREAERRLAALDEVTGVSILVTGAVPAAPKPRAKPSEGPRLTGIDRIVAVGSGKGGVGKSTVTANLAVALAAAGRRVGLLDADIYGPSQPQMLGEHARPASPDGQRITPKEAHGVRFMSIGLMTRPEDALIWRGPMLMGALQQLLGQVEWGRLDILLVDLPPGTGDVQLSLTQKAKLSGAIVVSTPQDVALIDARRAMDMFRKVDVPVLGMIENMSMYVCPVCGDEAHIFGHGGTREEAARQNVPFLGEIPLDLATRLASDAGRPVVLEAPDGAPARAFRTLAERMIAGGMA
ncbi:Mrp/NBP35 family ATP-binding protein [Oceanicella sp. SM1341]|uniref:Mrp/NBP35 family ATP-binding protein n=1 Tax=Oceanicella sp. SM1341 TaxID=1548889 RepID=UPI000E555DBA|nr:Mrp/NBP35 family ATP-binding protein [Oceanicella sp. SM1341]